MDVDPIERIDIRGFVNEVYEKVMMDGEGLTRAGYVGREAGEPDRLGN